MERGKYPKFAPILYAAREDGRRIDDRTKVFMNPQLVLVSMIFSRHLTPGRSFIIRPSKVY